MTSEGSQKDQKSSSPRDGDFLIALSGGCHWCTEGIFISLRGVTKVDQGWIKSTPPNGAWAEGVIVHYDPDIITAKDLIEVHLETHSSTGDHPLRWKYRSAIYYKNYQEEKDFRRWKTQLAQSFEEPILTQILLFVDFKLNKKSYLDYYRRNPDAPFCKRYISPKLDRLRKNRPELMD
ncbi:MAG: peptide-methionine (S)-S-oxide reductase [Bacteroidota bacterium]